MPERDLQSNPVLPDILTLAYMSARNDITAVNHDARNETINALYGCYERARAMLPFDGTAHGFFTRLCDLENEIYGTYNLSNEDYPAMLREAYSQVLRRLPNLTEHQREAAKLASERYKAEAEDISLRDFMLPATPLETSQKPTKRPRKYFKIDLSRFDPKTHAQSTRPRAKGFGEILMRFFEQGVYNEGRSPVSDFVWPALTVGGAGVLLVKLFPVVKFNLSEIGGVFEAATSAVWTASLLWLLICAIPFIELCIRRMHDLNMRANVLAVVPFLFLVPIVRVAVLMVWLMLMLSRGTQGENRFGADPLEGK